MKSRKDELLSVFDNAEDGIKTIVRYLIDDMVYLESELSKLRKLPFFLIDKKNLNQKRTEASILYASLISRYVDIVNKLAAILRREEIPEVSPLRVYLETLEKGNGNTQD